MLAKLGGDETKLTAWIRSVMDAWQGKVDRGEAVPDGNDFEFWRHRWDETHGSTKTAAKRPDEPASRAIPDAAATRAMIAEARKVGR